MARSKTGVKNDVQPEEVVQAEVVEPEVVEPEADESEADESEVDGLVLKKPLFHRGVAYKVGTPLSEVQGCHAGVIAFLRRVGTI